MNTNNYILEYYNQIKSGNIKTSQRVKQIYQKLVEDLEDNSTYIFDVKRANKPIEFIERFCKHSKGELGGQNIKLELFQKAFISALFGFINKETGLRKYRQAFFEVARKNGKSTMLAGLALYMLIADNEKGSEVYSIATKKDQASIIFDITLNMVKQSEVLARATIKKRSYLSCPLNFGKFEPLGKNSQTLDGVNAHCVILDELHAVKDRNLYEVMVQSMASRSQPLFIMITTAGTTRENIFDDIYNYSCNILDGKVKDESFLPIIYELDEKEEWKNPECWIKANPGLGTIKKYEDLEIKVNKAKQNPSDITGLLTKDFNIQENEVNSWLDLEDIINEKEFNITDFKGSYFIGGVDLSSVNDLTCATALMIDKETEEKFVYQMYWLPEARLEDHIKSDNVPYDIWIKRGFLKVCKGNKVDYHDVSQWFLDLVKLTGINPFKIYYDPWHAGYWDKEMKNLGFNLVECRQGFKTLSSPMKVLESDLKAKQVNYNNNPILKWCLANTDYKCDENENIRPVKMRNPNKRIDGMASLLNAYVGLQKDYEEFRRLGK